MIRHFVFVFVWLTLASTRAFAAACCGGAFSAPALILGDDKALFTSSYSYSKVVATVSDGGVWVHNTDGEQLQTLKLESAYLLSDMWQAGVSVPVTQISRDVNLPGQSGQQNGLGDIVTNLGYEYLSDWDYNPYRPKGVGYLSLTLPTGPSAVESEDPEALDGRGRGFWALGVGTVLSKIIMPFDVEMTFDIHHSFARTFSSPTLGGDVQQTPGWGGDAGFSGGYSRGNLRVGGGVQWTYEDAVKSQGAIVSDGSLNRLATASLIASYLFDLQWATSLSYSDQTLFGDPLTTNLSRTVLVSLQRRWER